MSTERSHIRRLGTRGSHLALWQARHVQEAIARAQPSTAIEVRTVETRGDVLTDTPLWTQGGQGFFTSEIDQALLSGEIDLAVHSLKDVETETQDGLTIAAVLPRGPVEDVLVSRGHRRLEELPRGARVGTCSLRRRASILRARPDLVCDDLRGNVPTRIARLDQGDYDAIVLAEAGLERLGLAHRIVQRLPAAHFVPAPAQGAIAVMCRKNDEETKALLRLIDDASTHAAVRVERAVLTALEAGCQAPVGVLAEVKGRRIEARARVWSANGRDCITAQVKRFLWEEDAIAMELAYELSLRGARSLIQAARASLVA